MKTTGILLSALLTTAFMFMGKERNQDFYLAALATGWVFFRLTIGNDCPIVLLMDKFGAGGRSCPADHKK